MVTLVSTSTRISVKSGVKLSNQAQLLRFSFHHLAFSQKIKFELFGLCDVLYSHMDMRLLRIIRLDVVSGSGIPNATDGKGLS